MVLVDDCNRTVLESVDDRLKPSCLRLELVEFFEILLSWWVESEQFNGVPNRPCYSRQTVV